MRDKIKHIIKESIKINNLIIEQRVDLIEKIVKVIVNAYRKGKKVVFFGNGGSAADAQHLATELVSRFKKERAPLAAIALTTNTSLLTAIGNDKSFVSVFSRQVEAIVKKGDIVIGISTSGSSKNILKGLKSAKKKGGVTIAFTGIKGKGLSKVVDFCFTVPSHDTPRIQEAHITVGHIICELVEETLF